MGMWVVFIWGLFWITSMFNILRNRPLFSKAAALIYIPNSNAQGLRFSSPFPALVTIFPFDYSHPSVKWYFTVALICISQMTNDVWASFYVLFGHLYSFFGEMSIWILCPSLNLVMSLLLSCTWTHFYLSIYHTIYILHVCNLRFTCLSTLWPNVGRAWVWFKSVPSSGAECRAYIMGPL